MSWESEVHVSIKTVVIAVTIRCAHASEGFFHSPCHTRAP